MAPVTFIPSQTVDESAFTSNRGSVSSPWKLFLHDAVILLHNLKYVFNTILPLKIPAHRHGVRYHLAPILANETLLALSIACEVILLAVGGVAVLLLPGWAFILFYLFTIGVITMLAAPGWGSRIVQSHNVRVPSNKFPHERWIFMNGVAQNNLDLQFTVDNLAATFQRPFLGIHNRSLGFVWDIGECLIQRCFGYSSEDVRICYDELKIPLLDPSITKVIVIAHSQGGIILSLTIDRMFAELPPAAMSKLEIYTFGSAAAHFNNPLRGSSRVDRSLRLRNSLETPHHRHDKPRRREELFPPVGRPTKDASPEIPIVETPQAPHILEQALSASPDGSPASEVDVGRLGGAAAPHSQNQQLIPSLEHPPASSPIRPTSPGLSIGKVAEAVVDTANVGSRTFFWKSLSEDSGRTMKESQSSNVKQQDHAKEDSSAAAFINPRDGAYDGTHSVPGHHHLHDGEHGHTNEGHEHIIPVIEHYCNELDMVPRWGVLNNVRSQPQLRYAGSVFIHRQMSGHLFNRHYLDTMFPMDKRLQSFLDQVVDVDIGTAKARASALASSISNFAEVEPGARNWLLYDSITELVSPSTFFARILALILYIRLNLTQGFWLGSSSLGQTTRILKDGVDLVAKERTGMDLEHVRNGDSLVEKAKALAGTVEDAEASTTIEEGSGKTVRQLSKLWRYMYGGTA
ncbi:hypothetical protein EV356DRAFT_500335 [Viridothelium virens]|uniref:DUF676 domain-containing protein n=1 Tax=Viridothelium virens TaxID=1048519 RepID=A0A6A6HC98_VIRVR|nr:hypothetical protein EV356DRAFT_500335 [Viridothelium virens]